MSADDVGHRATGGTGTIGARTRPDAAGDPVTDAAPLGFDAVAARVPAEYRDAYLEGFARARAVRAEVAA